jgi:hypothetical protein
MMSNTGEPAFPTTVRDHYDPETGGQWSEHVDPGMTLRDYFAAKAMQGFLSAQDCGWAVDEMAGAAYAMADAMLKAREK